MAYRQKIAPLYLKETSQVGDPMLIKQWHLRKLSDKNNHRVPSLNVEAAWEAGFNGSGVVVSIVDDGVQLDHRELIDRVRSDLSVDINDDDSDPAPNDGAYHGVACAGLVAAEKNNGICGAGVAYSARIAAVKLLGAPSSDLQQSESLSHGCKSGVDVYTNSWGPKDDGNTHSGPGFLVVAAMDECTRTGRDGLGCIYIWAAGNGRHVSDNCAYDGFVNALNVISVGSVDESGISAYYSEWCGAVFCVAPSSDTSSGVTTCRTKVKGGQQSSDCMTTFGGTSASCPMVAGVVALMLQANPRLTWQQVQLALASSCYLPDEENAMWRTNAAGIWNSLAYGYGVPDALAACRASELLATNYSSCAFEELSVEAVTYGTPSRVSTATVNVQDEGTGFSAAFYACVSMGCSGIGRGSIDVELKSPSGTLFTLASGRKNTDTDRNGIRPGSQFCSRAVLGEPVYGTWTVSATANANTRSNSNVVLRMEDVVVTFEVMNRECLSLYYTRE